MEVSGNSIIEVRPKLKAHVRKVPSVRPAREKLITPTGVHNDLVLLEQGHWKAPLDRVYRAGLLEHERKLKANGHNRSRIRNRRGVNGIAPVKNSLLNNPAR